MPNSNSCSYNILVTGSNGQVGSEIKELASNYPYNFFFTDRSNIDITNKDDIRNFCKTNNINVIINCAAYTAVDNYINRVFFTIRFNTLFICNIYIISICEKKVIRII